LWGELVSKLAPMASLPASCQLVQVLPADAFTTPAPWDDECRWDSPSLGVDDPEESEPLRLGERGGEPVDFVVGHDVSF